MTSDLAEALALLHAQAFRVPRPWSAGEFAAMLADPGVTVVGDGSGFALFRLAADEAELLTMAVPAPVRRQGRGRALLAEGLERLRTAGAMTCHLEVAADNTPAHALYRSAGFVVVGRRKGYYRSPDGTSVDAFVMRRSLPAAGPVRA